MLELSKTGLHIEYTTIKNGIQPLHLMNIITLCCKFSHSFHNIGSFHETLLINTLIDCIPLARFVT